MSSDYDPRAPRLNPGIRELVDIVDEHWRSLLHEQDYLLRKSKLRTVRDVLDQIIDQPEWLEPDLLPGAVEAVDCWLEPEEFEGEPAPIFLDERPFDRGGAASGVCFFYSDPGKLTPLYEGAPADPLVGPLRHHGPFIYTLEKEYATPADTAMHVTHANVWKQLVPPPAPGPSDPDAPRWMVLCDPRGVGGGGQSLCVASPFDRDEANDLANRLAERLEVRFVVARQARKWCNR